MATMVHQRLGDAQFPAHTRPIVQGFLAFDDSEWCLQPHQGLCVAGQDRVTDCELPNVYFVIEVQRADA